MLLSRLAVVAATILFGFGAVNGYSAEGSGKKSEKKKEGSDKKEDKSDKKKEGSSEKKSDKPVTALDGKCSVCLVHGKDMMGKKEFTSVHNGLEYCFPSEKQKKAFEANPEKYAVQNKGICVVCQVDKNKDSKGDPKLFSVHEGKIYLFVSEKAKKKFDDNPKKYAIKDKKDDGSSRKKNDDGSGKKKKKRKRDGS